MNLQPYNQTKLYGLDKYFNQFKDLYKSNKLPNKILLSGPKGTGKSTLAYHLINYVFSLHEENPYKTKDFMISNENQSFRLIQQNVNPNFTLLDVTQEKKNIDIKQVRQLITNMTKTSLNTKPRFVLIDNIEFLNLNSINALLKILEEPSKNTYFILINNCVKILSTLKSRCLEFKITLSNLESLNVAKKLIDTNIDEQINKDLINYYFTPGKIYNLIKFSNEFDIDIKNLGLKDLIYLIIDQRYYKKDSSIRYLIFELIEFYLRYNLNSKFSTYNYFIRKIENLKRFNLDQESFFLELKSKMLNE
tara:strand:+ start:1264 stop:2181 length:918 start_codon:yes stop_codon:yes gene_type:complete